jgi:hypothetical protein
MGFFTDMKNAGVGMIKKAAAAASKDDMIADRLFSIVTATKAVMINSVRGADIHKATFEVGDVLLDVTIQRRTQSSNTRVVGLPISLATMPTMCDITFKIYKKPSGFLGSLIKPGKTMKYVLNADDYIDDDLKIKNPSNLDKKLSEYLKATGL